MGRFPDIRSVARAERPIRPDISCRVERNAGDGLVEQKAFQ